MASKLGKATKKDLQSAMKKMMKVRTELTSMNRQNWLLVGFGDAGVKSMPDKITSVCGHVKILCDIKTNKCCVLG